MQDIYSDTAPEKIDPNTFGGYRMMTAEIVFSEGPGPEAAVTWQDYDLTPGFPRLRAFLDRWRDDPVHRVRSVLVTEIAEAIVPACRISPSTAALH